MSVISITVLSFAIISLVGTAALVVVTIRALPQRLRQGFEELRSRVSAVEATAEDLSAAWTRARAGLEGLQDEIGADLDRVEKRRRRVQASERRAGGGGTFEADQPLDAITDPEAQRRAATERARKLGLPC